MRKEMKSGYTTGSCAAAGTKAALLALQGNVVKEVELHALSGELLHIPIESVEFTADGAKAEVIKDGGDDPDITHGASVFTEVVINPQSKTVNFHAGLGIGIVTQPGLSVEPGQPAINPGPRKMMTQVVQELLPQGCGCDITVSIPKGIELAKKTLNPILGIEGGISVIGTTGIVRPMSEEGFKNSLTPQISVAKANGYNDIVFVPGKIGENIAKALSLPSKALIQTSNFIGHMLEFAVDEEIKSVLLFGHLGKLVKVAGGIFYTHSKIADARLEIMASYAAMLGMDSTGVKEIFSVKTTEAAMPIIEKYGLVEKGYYDLLAQRASLRSQQHVFNAFTVGTVIVTLKGEILGMDDNAKQIGGRLGWNLK
ncbi:MAG TPA: cobalt-precorrin-5B (C(1))-methyltransferase CbiD [Candidatus Megamonas gallistercoris]|nr:cobalt-precorrin-5B (C(1))-methyltransferase CbiD [Candidatus Megamonas gallistercoris]